MPTVLDSLVLEFNLDTSQFTREQQRLMDQIRKLEEDTRTQAINIESQFKRIGNLFSNLQRGALGVIGGMFGGQALSMINTFNNLEAQAGRVGETVGMTATQVLGLSNAMKAFGYDSQTGIAALTATNAAIITAQRNPASMVGNPLFTAAAMLGGRGQSPIDILHGGAGGGPMTALETWRAVLQRMDRMNMTVEAGRGRERAGWLQQIGIPEFAGMHTADFERILKKQQEMSAVTDRQFAQAKQWQEDTAALDTAFQDMGRSITHDVTPALLDLAKYLKEVSEKYLKPLLDAFNSEDPTGMGAGMSWLGPLDPKRVHDYFAGGGMSPFGKYMIGFGGAGGHGEPAANDAEREAFIRKTAKDLGLDPDVVVKTWTGEGRYGRGERRQSTIPGEQSFGDFQGNLNAGNLGDLYQKQTGHQIGDPRFWKEEDRWMMEQMRFNPAGLSLWHGWSGPAHAGGAGMGQRSPNQHVSFNIQNMNVHGSNSAEVAANIGRQTERLKMAYYGNNAAV
jgi:hypothetical protein